MVWIWFCLNNSSSFRNYFKWVGKTEQPEFTVENISSNSAQLVVSNVTREHVGSVIFWCWHCREPLSATIEVGISIFWNFFLKKGNFRQFFLKTFNFYKYLTGRLLGGEVLRKKLRNESVNSLFSSHEIFLFGKFVADYFFFFNHFFELPIVVEIWLFLIVLFFQCTLIIWKGLTHHRNWIFM